MRRFFVVFILASFLAFPLLSLARIGVGVGTGKIIVDEPMKAGGIYTLPPLTVLNTGDEPSDYQALIQYHTNQPQLSPSREWFSFNPPVFYLEPGEAQMVEIKLNLPLKTEPGEYFAYLEGRPAKKEVEKGKTAIGVAAAAKLYFTVSPANIFQGIYYRTISLWKTYAPWTNITASMIIAALTVILFRRFFSFQVGVRKKIKEEQKEEQKVE